MRNSRLWRQPAQIPYKAKAVPAQPEVTPANVRPTGHEKYILHVLVTGRIFYLSDN